MKETKDKCISNILVYFLFTIDHLSFTVRQRFLPVSIFVFVLINVFTLSQAADSKLKCSDDTLAQHFNCSSTDCVYGEESLVKCTLPMSKDFICEVN